MVYPSRDKINATHLSLTPKKMKVRNGKEQSRCREQVVKQICDVRTNSSRVEGGRRISSSYNISTYFLYLERKKNNSIIAQYRWLR